MNDLNKNKKIVNKHFLNSLLLFLAVLIIVLTFISFLEEAQEKDKFFVKNKEIQKKNNKIK